MQLLFHAFASDVEHGGPVQGVVFETKSGPLVIRARVVVDCTGDADVAARAGAPYRARPRTGWAGAADDADVPHGAVRAGGVRGVRGAHPEQWRGVHGLWDLIRKATAAGELDLPREDILFFGTPHEGEVSVNSTRVMRVLGTDVFDWSCAEVESRRQMRQIVAFLRRYVPGFERAYIAQSGVHTRRAGDAAHRRRLSAHRRRRARGAQVRRRGRARRVPGRHPQSQRQRHGAEASAAGRGLRHPAARLLPRGIEGVLVAGRCLSGTHEAHSSYRVMPIVMATGQAAGVCAALAARRGLTPRAVPVADVQAALIAQGADLRHLG